MHPNPIRLLLVDDDEDEFIITKDLLAEIDNEKYHVDWISHYETALNTLGQGQHDLCLLDYRLGAHDGLELLREASRRQIKIPIILLTGQGDRNIDLEAMKAGAADYLVKGQLQAGLLERAIRYALERARSLEILRASEERYRALFQNHPHPMWVHDLSTLSFLAVNTAAINRYGYSEEEFRTLTVEAIWAPVELPAALSFPAEFQDSFVQAGCRRHRRKDGSTFLVELAFHDLQLGPRPARLVLAQDITEQQRAQEARRESENRYQQLLEIIPDGIGLVDAKGWITLANQQIAQILGHRRWQELVGQHLAPYVAPEELPRVVQDLQMVRQSGSIKNAKYTFVRTDGTRFPVEVNACRVVNPDGSLLVLGVIRDVSQRKQAEAEHRRVEAELRKEAHAAIEKLAAFPRQNPNPVLEFAADGTLSYFNAAAAEMAQRLNHQHPSEILPPHTPDIVRDCLASGQRRLRVETVHDGRTLSWSFFPIQSGHVVHCYAGDITEKLNLEAQLQHAQKLESVGQLAAGVAHDFNNILTVIRGQASLLLSGNKRAEEATDALHQICESTDRAMNLTRQLLAFSRRQIMQPRALNLNEVVNNIAKMLGRLLTESIALEFQSAPELPSLWADPGMMEQVLVNLAINARDAMPNGGRLLIRTSTATLTEGDIKNNPDARPGHFICLTVADTGCGMDAATLERIFEPFFTTKEAGKGTGLGLATVYGIVKQHEGWIEVNSQLDQGTRFQLFFPPSSISVEAKKSSSPPPSPRGSQECILVVEDEPRLRDLIMEVLEISGYKVFGAGSGVEALQLWSEHKAQIHLLFTDLVMPSGLSGRHLAEKLQADNPGLKAVYTTGYSTELFNQGFPLHEGRNFVPKPFHPELLAQTVRYCLDH